MNTFIVLLRGINVGGHKKVPMAELREVLLKTGFNDVKTYIQSGNIILKTEETQSEIIENKVHKAILSHFGFDVPVIVRTRPQLLKNFEDCPFSEENTEKSYFVILSKIPNESLVKEARNISFENEEFRIINDCLYLFSSIGYGKSKFNMNAFEKKLNVKATSRNYKTMLKLLSLSTDS